MTDPLRQFYTELHARPTQHVTLALLQKYAALPRTRSRRELRVVRAAFEALKHTTPLLRARHRCGLCSAARHVHLHHIIPLSCGGSNNLYNLIPLCGRCHSRVHPWLATEEDPLVQGWHRLIHMARGVKLDTGSKL